MALCPFYESTFWRGNLCRATGNGDGESVQKRYEKYCGTAVVQTCRYQDCPLYKDATGKRNNGGCYLTSACMKAKGEEFSDTCEELQILRDYRDSFLKENYPQDIERYYVIAPKIVEKVQLLDNSSQIFEEMYVDLVLPCCELIKENRLYEAYEKYKNYSLALSKEYVE